jgi:hypothetical protein
MIRGLLLTGFLPVCQVRGFGTSFPEKRDNSFESIQGRFQEKIPEKAILPLDSGNGHV